MTNKLITIKQNIIKDTCPKLNKDNNRIVKKLVSKEITFKTKHDLDCTILYIDVKYRKHIRPKARGFYNTKLNEIVVFVDISEEYDRILETLYHELTHAYQYKYMNKKYMNSCKELKTGNKSYKNSWHEIHAKQTALSLIA